MLTKEYWDVLATIFDTDLYGLLNILLKDSHYDEDDIIDTIKTLKASLGVCTQKEEPKNGETFIEDEWRKPTVKPVAYMTSDMLKGVMRYIYEGDLMGAGMTLKSLIKVVDDETMKKVQQLVEGNQPNK